MQYSVLAHVVLPTPVASNTGVDTRVQLKLREENEFVRLVLLSDNLLTDVESEVGNGRSITQKRTITAGG
jgi:F420-0:gamma-glutamyl ligase-like protein